MPQKSKPCLPKYSKRFKNIKFSSMRMQAMNFTKGLNGSKELRGKIINTTDKSDLERLIKEFRSELKRRSK